MDRTLWCNLYYAVSQVIGKENLNTTVTASSICTVWFYCRQITVNLSFIPRQLRVTSKKSALHMSHLRPITLGLQLQLPYSWNEMKEYKSTSSNQRLWECVRCRINVYPDTLNDFPSWLSTSKNQSFFINNRGFTKRYFSDKVHASVTDWWYIWMLCRVWTQMVKQRINSEV